MEDDKVQPVTEETEEIAEDTNPREESAGDIPTVSVKFNKQTRSLTLDEAKNLAQKGLKYELIADDFERLKALAKKAGQSTGEFLSRIEQGNAEQRKAELIEQTGGNRELADYIISLENSGHRTDNGFEELKSRFPEINEIGELPGEVIEASNQTGKNLLDCYLRYLLSEKQKEQAQKEQIKAARLSGIGSLKPGVLSEDNAANHEFLKGVWGK